MPAFKDMSEDEMVDYLLERIGSGDVDEGFYVIAFAIMAFKTELIGQFVSIRKSIADIREDIQSIAEDMSASRS